jgi:hypothetical protein
MKDAKINMNRNPLTPEEVSAAKDFDALNNIVEPEPPKKWKGKVVAVVAALGVAAVIYFVMKPSGNDTDNKEKVKMELVAPIIQSPIDGLDVPVDQYSINAETGGVLETPIGTRILIPGNAFLNKDGTLVKGEVKIAFREFHDVPSIFAAGIPMDYDSAGVNYQFESAGMFEIYASQNDVQLKVNPEALINVELSSSQAGNYFNIYKQKEDGTWDFIQKDTAGVKGLAITDSVSKRDVKLAKKDFEKVNKEFADVLKEEGVLVPQEANDNLYSMKLAYKPSEFPELASFKNVIFEITENNEEFEPEMANIDWDNIKLETTKNGYNMILTNGKKKTNLEVEPVFANAEINAANATFEEMFASYDVKLEGKLTELKLERDSLFRKYKGVENSYKLNEKRLSNISINAEAMSSLANKVTRVFTLSSFGMWNSDCPAKLPKGSMLNPMFVNSEKPTDTLWFAKIYIAEYDKNALFTLSGNWGNKNLGTKAKPEMEFLSLPMSFNPESKTVIWAVTADAQLAVLKPENFDKIKNNGEYDVIPLEIIKVRAQSIADVKKALNWQ